MFARGLLWFFSHACAQVFRVHLLPEFDQTASFLCFLLKLNRPFQASKPFLKWSTLRLWTAFFVHLATMGSLSQSVLSVTQCGAGINKPEPAKKFRPGIARKTPSGRLRLSQTFSHSFLLVKHWSISTADTKHKALLKRDPYGPRSLTLASWPLALIVHQRSRVKVSAPQLFLGPFVIPHLLRIPELQLRQSLQYFNNIKVKSNAKRNFKVRWCLLQWNNNKQFNFFPLEHCSTDNGIHFCTSAQASCSNKQCAHGGKVYKLPHWHAHFNCIKN